MEPSSAQRTTKDQDSQRTAKAAARKLKKRELDRNAQRVARERTKKRIQELESLVEQLKADAVNPELSNLMVNLEQVTKQRDELQSVIRSINQAVQRHVGPQKPSSPTLKPQRSVEDYSRDCPLGVTNTLTAASSEPQNSRSPGEYDTAGGTVVDLQTMPEIWDTMSLGALPSGESRDAHMEQLEGALPSGEGWTQPSQSLTAGSPPMHDCGSSSDEIIVPRPQWPCDCVRTESANTWRTANTALGKSTVLSRAQLAVEDFTSEDTAVRVVLDGWDSVAREGKMSISWRKLRAIDEACFSTCGDVERLGILRTMHLLLMYHGDPTEERCNRVPRWLWMRPSQSIPHSYAIDFFVWPGLRERFIFTQHRYCTNVFWQLFRDALRLAWPFSLADCYGVDPDTGRYTLSPAFDNSLRDINTWRMTVDFFSQFPELCGDIPVSGSIAPAVRWTKDQKARHKLEHERHRRQSTQGLSDVFTAQSQPRGACDHSLVISSGNSYDYPLPPCPELRDGPWPSC